MNSNQYIEAKLDIKKQLKSTYELVDLLDTSMEHGFPCARVILRNKKSKKEHRFTYTNADEYEERFKKYRKKRQIQKDVHTYKVVTGDVFKGELLFKGRLTDMGDFITIKQGNGEEVEISVKHVVWRHVKTIKVWEE